MNIQDYQSTYHMLMDTVNRIPDKKAYRWFDSQLQPHDVTWRQFVKEVDQLAGALLAFGLKKDEKVTILSNTNYQWVLTDVATASAGGVTVGIYQTLLAPDCQYIIDHSDSVIIFAEDLAQVKKIAEVRSELTKVRQVVLFRGESEEPWVQTFEEFLALGKTFPEASLKSVRDQLVPEDSATIVYTSGTTGLPKGAELSHKNMTFSTQSVVQCVQTQVDDETLLFLPLAHVFARILVYAALHYGATTNFARSVDTLIEDLGLVKPHWFASVPRVYEKVFSKINSGAEAKGGVALKLFRWAVAVGAQASALKAQHKPISGITALKYQIANKLVFSKIHAALGGRVRWAISGAAPLNAEIAKFFDGAGVPILEGIGMTENTSFSNVNRYDNYKFGTVGQAGPGVEIKIGEDGEFMVRGDNVMKGYYKMPDKTAETIDSEGWLLTGDLATIDEEGFVTITGRKKDLIITSGGKNVAPSKLEGTIALSQFINQVCVVGDRHNYLCALVTIDIDNVKEYAAANGIDAQGETDLIANDEIKNLIMNEVEKSNQEFASFETIKKITLVPEFTLENDMLTPTMKVKRNIVMQRYADAIEAMYH
ncbi:MAG TPA: long-chain fatty acid--CoA ligase [Gammaproteobacteria bacterium]|nr:long-chain fatty acid--CoA ligase [Gammaproteobacteria bacterium]